MTAHNPNNSNDLNQFNARITRSVNYISYFFHFTSPPIMSSRKLLILQASQFFLLSLLIYGVKIDFIN